MRFKSPNQLPPRIALAEDLAGPLLWRLTHQDHCESLELLGEVLAAALLGRSYTLQLAVVTTASPRHGTHNHALLVDDVQMPPLHRLDTVVAGSTLSRPEHFPRATTRPSPSPSTGRSRSLPRAAPQLHDKPSQAQAIAQTFHLVSSACIILWASSPPTIPLKIAKN